jgi:hypothetical protein
MSPNSYLAFNDAGLLCGYQGEYEEEEPVFTWTYSEFEEYIDEAVTPSMYHFMANYVDHEFTKEELYEIQGGDYCTGDLEAEAVDAYFALPINERIRLHEQELVNLNAAKRRAESRESAAIDAMLEEHRPFDDTSPIALDYAECMRAIITKERKNIDRLTDEIHEEEQWRGGHEEGAEDDAHLNPYDPMEEY